MGFILLSKANLAFLCGKMLLLPPLGLWLGSELRERKPTAPAGGRAGHSRGFQRIFPFAVNPTFWLSLFSSVSAGALDFLVFSTVTLLLI